MTPRTRSSAWSFLAAFGAALAFGAQPGALTRLGAAEAEIRDSVFHAISGGFFSPAGNSEVFKGAPAAGRVAMVKAAMAAGRAYASEPAFARRYAQFREERKPSPPRPPAETGDPAVILQRQGLQEALANALAVAAEDPTVKEEMEALAAELRRKLDALGGNHPNDLEADRQRRLLAAADDESYRQAVDRWNLQYPADPKRLVAMRLREFLDLAATVDFTARTRLDPTDRKRRFVDEAYEKKGSRWKLLYRAGKPSVDAARLAAQDWLKAIGG